jgi:dolichyl-phosphate-mannose-protein mannosyltransferase
MRNRVTLTACGVGVSALAFFLFGIGTPSIGILDEDAYVLGARSLLTGTQDWNPAHPPLAKFLIAAGMKVAGDTAFGWRVAGAILGALTLVAIFLWTYLLLQDYMLSLTAAALTLFNNFLFVMSRVAMLDVFYFAFVMWGVLAFSAALLLEINIVKRRALIVASGILFGLGGACKWNAVVTLAAVGLLAVILYVRNSHHLREIRATTLAVSLLFVPVATYVLAYWPLCYRFHMEFSAATLGALTKFIWLYHKTCPGNPALDVHWYLWFFRTSPERGLSYLMGNWVVAWVGMAALATCIWKFLRSLATSEWALAEGMVVLFYAVNLLQWVIIPQKRLVYYYYFPPAMFLSVAIAIVLRRYQSPRLFGVRISLLLVVAAAVFFMYCYPRMCGLEAPYDCMFGCWI